MTLIFSATFSDLLQSLGSIQMSYWPGAMTISLPKAELDRTASARVAKLPVLTGVMRIALAGGRFLQVSRIRPGCSFGLTERVASASVRFLIILTVQPRSGTHQRSNLSNLTAGGMRSFAHNGISW
jgi:hypothetical protein